MMKKKTYGVFAIVVFLLTLFVFSNNTVAQDQLFFKVSKDDERITLASGDAVFTVKVAQHTLITVSGCRTAFITIQNRTDEFSVTPERLKEVTVLADNDDHKIIKAVFSLVYTTKNLGQEYKDCELELLLEVKKNIPCLFLTSKLKNTGQAPFLCYSFWGWFAGTDYTTPDLKINSWINKYSNLPAVEWVYLSPRPRIGQNNGYGIISFEQFQQTVDSSLIVITTPTVQTIQPNHEIQQKMVLLPAKDAEEVKNISQKVKPFFLPKNIKASETGASALTNEEPGPDSDYYKTRMEFIGYPALPLSDEEKHLPKNSDDWKYNLRMTDISCENITKDIAESIAQQAKKRGINVILEKYNRNIFLDKEDKFAMPGHAFISLDEMIRTTKFIVDACHKYGIKFFLHTSCTMVTSEYISKHPDYAPLDMATGKPIENGYGSPAACIANKKFQEDFLKRIERLIKETGADGLMADEITFWSLTAVSPSGRSRFKEETGLSLPTKYDSSFVSMKNPVYTRWLEWREEKVMEVNLAIKSIAEKHGAICITYRSHNMLPTTYFTSGKKFTHAIKWADSIGYECEPPGYPADFLYCYSYPHVICEMKNLRSISDNIEAAPWTLFYPRTYGDYTWCWLIAMSQGCHLWWISEDKDITQPLINWEQKYEDVLARITPYANIAIPFSTATALHSPKYAREWLYGFAGLCTALTDSHIPYRVILDEDLNIEKLSNMKIDTLLLLNTDCMSEKAIVAVEKFVEEGGVLIASGNTSLYDGQGNKRKDFGLVKLFGTSYSSESDNKKNILSIPVKNELTEDFTGNFEHNKNFTVVKVNNGKTIGEMIEENGIKHPGIVLNSYGKGSVVYFSGHPELKYFYTFYGKNEIKSGKYWKDDRDNNFRKILKQCAVYKNKKIPLIVENLPTGVVVEAYKQKYEDLEGIQVHLINLLGGKLKEGFVPAAVDISFPDVSKYLPNPTEPISILIRARNIKKVYLISPDFDQTVDIPFVNQGEYIKAELPVLYRYAILYFSQGKDDRILQITKGKTVNKIPEAKKLKFKEKVPLVGKYDHNNIVIFADSKKIVGGKYSGSVKGVLSRVIYGAQSNISEIKTTFTLNKKVKKITLEIGAKDDNATTKALLDIRINNNIVFKGASTYPDNDWDVRQFEVKPEYVQLGENLVVIKNIGDGVNSMPPWQSINFIKVIPEYE